jgi:hypothetical protein
MRDNRWVGRFVLFRKSENAKVLIFPNFRFSLHPEKFSKREPSKNISRKSDYFDYFNGMKRILFTAEGIFFGRFFDRGRSLAPRGAKLSKMGQKTHP